MNFEYVFKHKIDGDIQTLTFTIEQIENGGAKYYVSCMGKDGYELITRRLI